MTNKRKIGFTIFLILTIIWMGIVFYLSAENAEASSQTSRAFMDKIIAMFNIKTRASLEGTIRTWAHFVLYLSGGLVSSCFFVLWLLEHKLKFMYCSIFGVLYAVSDEIHQIFVPGRAFEIKDIMVDCTGFLIGVLIIALATLLTNRDGSVWSIKK